MKTRHVAHHVPVNAVRTAPARPPHGGGAARPTYAGAMATIERGDRGADFGTGFGTGFATGFGTGFGADRCATV